MGRLTMYLLVLNLLVLGVGFGMEKLAAHRAPALNEFNAGKIRFWSQPETYKSAAEAAPAKPAEAAPSPPRPGRLCLDIADLSQARYREMQAVLSAAGLDAGQCSYAFDKKLGWWVYWPPEYEAALRDKVIKSIQAAGVKDVLAITQGAMAQSFSLGVFVSESQARQYRDALRGKGLAKVESGPRPSMAWARLGCVLNDAAKLDGFKASLPAWAKEIDAGQCPLAN
jgi:hypothetical protein